MKSAPMNRASALAALLALPLLALACGRERPAPPPPSTETPPAVESLRHMHVLTADGKVAVTFKWDDEEVQVFFNEDGQRRFLRSRLGKGRQRRWSERGVGPVALVRTNAKGDAFSLLSEDGSTLWWRVRLRERIALFRNHPSHPGFDLRLRRDKGVRVTSEKGDELGHVQVQARNGQVRVLDAQGEVVFKTARKAPVSMLYGALLAPELDRMARYILMGEILVRQSADRGSP